VKTTKVVETLFAWITVVGFWVTVHPLSEDATKTVIVLVINMRRMKNKTNWAYGVMDSILAF
tara:strand:+ start:1042 stop:1227 length:186 start_codon:yes stop_codon:yes gene_type:complete